MIPSITINTTAGSFHVKVKSKDYLVLAQREEWLSAQIARHIRERLSAFVKYRAHAFGARHTNPDAFVRINNIGYLVACFNGKSLAEVCRLMEKRAADIQACLPSEQSKHAFWRSEINILITYAYEYNTRSAVRGSEGINQATPYSSPVQKSNHS